MLERAANRETLSAVKPVAELSLTGGLFIDFENAR